MIPVAGEAAVWFVAIMPVVALFVVLNVAWTSLIIVFRQRRQRFFLVMTAVIWLIGIGIDYAHHQCLAGYGAEQRKVPRKWVIARSRAGYPGS